MGPGRKVKPQEGFGGFEAMYLEYKRQGSAGNCHTTLSKLKKGRDGRCKQRTQTREMDSTSHAVSPWSSMGMYAEI